MRRGGPAMIDLIERLRLLEQDHEPDGWPAVRMRDITALLDAIEAARVDGWQPIETAPKDGRDILVSEYGDLEIAFWSGGVSKWFGPYDSFGDPEVMVP